MNNTPDFETDPASAASAPQTPNEAPDQPMVFVVDDDEAMRKALEFLLKSADLPVMSFDSAAAFSAYFKPTMTGCLLLDVRMPHMTGLELQQKLNAEGVTLPVIILTAHADVPMAVGAMRAGAFDFAEKPFDDVDLLARIRRALRSDAVQRRDAEHVRQIRKHIDRLSARERQVMDLVVAGMANKQIAAELNISMKTVEAHRARVMLKMQAESLADLVRMAIAVGAAPPARP